MLIMAHIGRYSLCNSCRHEVHLVAHILQKMKLLNYLEKLLVGKPHVTWYVELCVRQTFFSALLGFAYIQLLYVVNMTYRYLGSVFFAPWFTHPRGPTLKHCTWLWSSGHLSTVTWNYPHLSTAAMHTHTIEPLDHRCAYFCYMFTIAASYSQTRGEGGYNQVDLIIFIWYTYNDVVTWLCLRTTPDNIETSTIKLSVVLFPTKRRENRCWRYAIFLFYLFFSCFSEIYMSDLHASQYAWACNANDTT